jgi:hypothetical protein
MPQDPPLPVAVSDPDLLTPGRRVRVIKQMQLKGWTSETVGVVQEYEQRKTGSWYAHGKDDKLWLDRLVLVKDDGEIAVLNLDGYTRVESAEVADGGTTPDEPGTAT